MLSVTEITQLFDKHQITASERRIALARDVERAVLAKASQQVHGDQLPFIPWSKEREFFDSMPAPKQEPCAFEYKVEIDGGWVPRILKANAFGLNKTVYDFDFKNIKALYDHPATPQAAAVPEGWKLVPNELTFDMHEAAEKAQARHVINDRKRGGNDPDLGLDALYKAMLSAAPKPNAETQSVPDGYRLVPFPLPEPAQVRAAQLRSEVGGYICGNWANGYDCIYELYRVMIESAPKPEGE